ncbi:MAG: DUF2441 domain-containing protein [Cyclobacteriaceae bacterium]
MNQGTYYHIHRIDENNQQNDSFLNSNSVVIGENFENFYFKNQLNKYSYFTNEQDESGHSCRKSIFETFKQFHNEFPPLVFNYPEPPTNDELFQLDENYHKSRRVLEQSGTAFRHVLQVIRELTFEEVRLKNFKYLPSRKNCIWLCEDEAQLKDWKPNLSLNEDQYQILKVEVDGNIFKTDSKFIDTWELDISKYYENANQYWNPTSVFHYPEVLFTGELRILERFKKIEEIEFET